MPINGNLTIYENVNSQRHNNVNNNGNGVKNCVIKNASLPRPPKKPARERTNEAKLDVSNDDLLEAIEQLSMLSKPRNSTGSIKQIMTPKIERDNERSNEDRYEIEPKQLDEIDRKKYVEFLQNEKQHILGNMDSFKRSVADIEAQEEEMSREVSSNISI